MTAADLKGDLHCHTRASDGRNSLVEMAHAAATLGYEYLAITDHSKSLTVANGLDEKRLLEQIKAIDDLNEKLDGFTVARRIKAVASLKHIPIIFTTALDRASDKISGIQAGAKHYLTKPFKVDELVSKVTKLVEDGR